PTTLRIPDGSPEAGSHGGGRSLRRPRPHHGRRDRSLGRSTRRRSRTQDPAGPPRGGGPDPAGPPLSAQCGRGAQVFFASSGLLAAPAFFGSSVFLLSAGLVVGAGPLIFRISSM